MARKSTQARVVLRTQPAPSISGATAPSGETASTKTHPQERHSGTARRIPLVTLGMPVYNGAEFLKDAMDDILTQTFGDFELIIADNASTDKTPEICENYAIRDPRIRFVRNQTNIGGNKNHNRVLDLARGTYFKWCAHDDRMAPTYVERCVDVLDGDPTITLCHSQTLRFEEAGKPWRPRRAIHASVSSPRSPDRLREVLQMGGRTDQIYGLMRSEALRGAGGLGNYVGADRVVLVHLALRGRFFEVPEELFFRRWHPGMSTRRFRDPRDKAISFNLSRTRWIFLPQWRKSLEYALAVLRTPMSGRERLACFVVIARWLTGGRARKGAWRALARDLMVAARRVLPLRRDAASGRRRHSETETPPGGSLNHRESGRPL